LLTYSTAYAFIIFILLTLVEHIHHDESFMSGFNVLDEVLTGTVIHFNL